ncbi:MAG: ead/Ea22-like family protein [Patescibacteria group bacterium]|nr:ead/Ea22-like family protein [Patescibacteria group bacterium]
MTIDTKAIRERAEKATPGAWVRDMSYQHPTKVRAASKPYSDTWICDAVHRADCSVDGFANATFIAAARTDVPALCDEVDRLRAELAAKDDAVKALVEAAKAILTHACIADAAPEDVDDEDRQRERALRAALRPFLKEGE